MKKLTSTIGITALALASLGVSLSKETSGISAARYQQTVKTLASDKMKGRGTGTPELELAANYLAGEFRSIGIPPADGKSYFQRYEVTTSAVLGPDNTLFFMENGIKTALKLEEDYVPMNFSATAKISGPLVFAGYGITAPEYNYDDYAGLDVKGKIVIILRSEPQEDDEKSPFAGKAFTRHAQLESKATNARFHGALGVIFVNHKLAEAGMVPKFSKNVGPGYTGMPFVQVKASIVDQWLVMAGHNLKDIIAGIDKDLKPQSFELPMNARAALDVEVRREVKQVPNLAAFLKGETDEYLIVGAHFDHLGLGEQNSMAPSLVGQIHHGADDNASGTAGLLEIARYFKSRPSLKRGVLFLSFSGEELGLLGSSYYVNHPILPLDKAVAMINMDMIGRIRDGKVYVGGSGTGTTLKALLDEAKGDSKLNLDLGEQGGYGSSDHTSFTTKQVPVLFFFSGLHADYHTPSDTWDKIDCDNAALLLELVARVGQELVDAPRRPQFVKLADSRPPGAAPGSGGGSGYGAYFGSIPDFTEVPNGFKISDVREGSPAAKAGLKGGDVIFEFDGKPINNLYDFTYALRAKKPGDEVTVKAHRGPEVIEGKTTLTKRQ
jgi:aminopeptidase YwaD